ncbi:hypothetical protein BX666DRAFT_1877326 [Dichotomocladium elegans]|nr:hypothetical protein BX666DRAFT_1877326 [Dichotomocladium elegans]
MPTVRNRRNRNHKYAVPLLFTSPKLFPGSDDIDATTTTALTALPTSITEPEHRTLSSLLATNQNPSHRKPLPHTSPATIVKRFVKTTSTSKTLISSSSEISARVVQDHSYSALANLHRRDVLICLKSPHFVTGGKLDGTVVVDFPAGLSRPDLLESFHSFVIHLRGVESKEEGQAIGTYLKKWLGVVEPGRFRPETHTFQFLDRPILSLTGAEFVAMFRNDGPLSDGALCQPVRRTQHIWASPSSPTNAVHIDLNLARSLWVTDAPIYVHLELVNTSKDTVSDIKLELLRRQNTFSQTGLEGSFGLRPVTSILETVSEVLASSMGWILPIEPGMNDQAVMTLQSPGSRDRFTACSHKLIDESYSIRLSVMSSTRCSVDAVIEIPVVLAHPVSLDPPPGDYGTAITPSCQLIAPSMSLGMVHVGTPLPQKQPSAFHRQPQKNLSLEAWTWTATSTTNNSSEL